MRIPYFCHSRINRFFKIGMNMDFKALELLISETASQKGIAITAMIEDLADIVKMKYGIAIMEKERAFIEEVKNRVITKMYNSDNQKVNAVGDLQKLFKLDILESDYLDTAMDELQQEGLLNISKKEYTLTKEGVMKFKDFYGEI